MPTETVPESNDIETVAPARVGDTLGYARVSTNEQNPDAQSDRLIEAGAIRVFTDIVSAKRFDRPALAELIDHARPGDRLCIIRLDRLGRSLRELLETVDGLKARGIHLISLEERLDTSSAAGVLRIIEANLHRLRETDRTSGGRIPACASASPAAAISRPAVARAGRILTAAGSSGEGSVRPR